MEFRPFAGNTRRSESAGLGGVLGPSLNLSRHPSLPDLLVFQGVGAKTIVVNHELHGGLMFERLAGDLEGLAVGRLDVGVAIPDPDALAGESDQALDVVDLRLLGEPEDDDIPARRPPRAWPEGQIVAGFVDEDSVSLEARFLREIGLESAIATGSRGDPERHGTSRANALDFLRGIDRVDETALRAGDFLVPSHQGRCHGAGRDDKRLGFEAADQEGQKDGPNDRLDRVARGFPARLGRLLLGGSRRRGRRGGSSRGG